MYGFIDQVETSSNDGSDLTTDAYTPAAGDQLLVTILSTGSASISDSLTTHDDYQLIGTQVLSPFTYSVYAVLSSLGGSRTFTATGNVYGLLVQEFSGLEQTLPTVFDTGSATADGTPGANVIVGPSLTSTTVPAMLWALAANLNQDSSADPPSAGTSPLAFTGRTPVWEELNGTGTTSGATPEDYRLTDNAEYAATFGVENGTYDTFGIASVIWPEAASSTAPTITAQPVNQTVASGDTATFSVTATDSDGGEDLTYQWQSAPAQSGPWGAILGGPGTWMNISGATSASYTTGDLSTNGTWYQCLVSNPSGTVTTQPARAWLTGQSDQGLGAFELGWPKSRRGRDLRPGSDSWTRLYPQFGYLSGNQAGSATANYYFYAPATSGAISGTAALTLAASGAVTGAGALAGTASVTFAGSGTLTGSGAVEGTGTLALDGTGTLQGAGALDSAAAITFTASGTVEGAGSLAGVAALELDAAGTLYQPSLEGTAGLALDGTGSLTGAGTLAGTGAISLDGTASLAGAGALAGTAAATLGLTGAIAASGALAGTAAASLDATGTLGAAGALTGTSAMTFAASGILTQPGLSGTTGLTFAAAGTLSGAGALTGTVSLTFAADGTLTGSGTLTGEGTATFAASGTLNAAGALAGVAAATFGGAATLTATGALQGATGLTVGLTGTLVQPGLNGTAAITFAASGTAAGIGALSGTASLALGSSADLLGLGTLSGATGLTCTLAGTLTALGTLEGLTSVALAADGTLTASGALSGLTGLTFEATGSLSTGGAIAGVASLSFGATGTLISLLTSDPGYVVTAPVPITVVTAPVPITVVTAPVPITVVTWMPS